ncbi:MAG: twin-arginine translocase TatA/TatE family subunit [Taibaiella sp.]|nr:twin-arginine translocase TatA/TatE family subunit [Taibaiella sp.]
MPSGAEWLWVVLVVVILFGGKKIPELAKGIGKGIREFNDAKDGVKREIESGINEKPANEQK